MQVLAAVWFVASGATLLERRLVHMLLLVLLRLVLVAAQASVHRIGLHEARSLARVSIVAIGAFPRRTWVRYLGGFNLLPLVFMASETKSFRAGLHQHHLAILGGLVAGLAHLVLERIVRERLQQLGSFRLMRIVALGAVRAREGLIPVSLLQVRVLRIMAVEAKRRRSFRR